MLEIEQGLYGGTQVELGIWEEKAFGKTRLSRDALAAQGHTREQKKKEERKRRRVTAVVVQLLSGPDIRH